MRNTRVVVATLLLAVAPEAWSDAAPPATGADRGRAFWVKVRQLCEVPRGQSIAAIVDEAVALQASRDPYWRDDVGYQSVVRCVYKERKLTPDERRRLGASLVQNLWRGIGETGTDTVLLRSFSALDLSILQALELQDPVLDDAGFRALLDAAFSYLMHEKDGRGYVPGVGWVHATAHAADLLKFLARDARFTPDDQTRLLEAAWLKATSADTPAWEYSENERLAGALLAVTRRTDFDVAGFSDWLGHFPQFEKNFWSQPEIDPDGIEATQNARDLLQNLFVQLNLEQPTLSAAQQEARAKLLETLRQIRR